MQCQRQKNKKVYIYNNNKFNTKRSSGDCSFKGYKGGRISQRSGNSGKYNDKSYFFDQKPQCYYYKRFDHIEKYCRFNEKQANFVKDNEKKDPKNAFLAYFSTKECTNSVWYTDSSCSNKMISNSEAFVTWINV